MNDETNENHISRSYNILNIKVPSAEYSSSNFVPPLKVKKKVNSNLAEKFELK